MCKITSVASGKGGLGKTTSTVNISSYIAKQGFNVLVVDLDIQKNLSTSFGVFLDENSVTIKDLFQAVIENESMDKIRSMVEKSIVKTNTVDIIPSAGNLSQLENIIPTALERERILTYILSCVKERYDHIFIDCLNGPNLFIINAFTASDSVLIPVEPHILSADGLDLVEGSINLVQQRLNSKLVVEGILFTKHQKRPNSSASIIEQVKTEYEGKYRIFDSIVPYSIAAAEAPAFGMSIHEYAPKNPVAYAYAAIAKEVMKICPSTI